MPKNPSDNPEWPNDKDLASKLASLSLAMTDPRKREDLNVMEGADSYFLMVKRGDHYEGRMNVPDGNDLEMYGACHAFLSKAMQGSWGLQGDSDGASDTEED